MDLSSPVTTLTGVGPAVAKKLQKLGISSTLDLLYHLPFRYEDRSLVSPVSRLQAGETATIIGKLTNLKNEYTRGGKTLQTGLITDYSGSLPAIWFNQPFLTKTLQEHPHAALWGKIDTFKGKTALISPEYELITDNTDSASLIHMGRLVPVYPETSGLSSKWFRSKINNLLNLIPEEIYPASPDFSPWKKSLLETHFPTTSDPQLASKYRSRLAFDELFLLQLTSLLHRQAWDQTKLSHPFALDKTRINKFISSLPFTLTPSQLTAVKDILTELADVKPMNRLLEGDVGSGKTVVAAIAAYVAYLNGFQTLILAPTQILAHQHFQTLTSLFQPLNITTTLITSSHKTIKTSNHVVIGTHALLSKRLKFEKVGLVVIDEQHRFGVAQRAIAANLGQSPHILTMTATPIPRSVALTLHGDLDLSILSDMPPGRLPVRTWVVPPPKRDSAYAWIKSQKTQIFIICPFIEPSETLSSVKAATAEFAKITTIFSGLNVGLLHGKLKIKEKEEVMEKFKVGEYQILVCTPIVEVGIDIPTAGIIVIEDTDRYGLAQLHQLRGRVGRGSQQSYCLLFGPPTPRLKAMETHTSGLELAEIDLRLRGPGQIYGHVQHGLSDLKIASYTDSALIAAAKSHASALFPRLHQYPLLSKLVQTDKIGLIQPN